MLSRLAPALAVSLLGTACAGCPEREAAAEPSVLLVTVDTLRADHLPSYGYGVPTARAIEDLAATGTVFLNAFSASSSTVPSHNSIFTGRYPSYHSTGGFNGRYRLREDETTLAEIAREHGLRTAAVVGNPLLQRRSGLAQGFETYDDRMTGRELNRGIPERYADDAVDRAIAALNALGDQRFFFWLHLQDAHGPYAPPEMPPQIAATTVAGDDLVLPVGADHSGYRAIPAYQVFEEERDLASYVRRYDAEIAFLDRHLSRLLDYLRGRPDRDSILLILTADHGEAFGEDDFYFAHGHSVALDQVRVPLLLAGPEVPAGRTVREPVSNVAVFPTVLDALGIASRAGDVAEASGSDGIPQPSNGPRQGLLRLLARLDRSGSGPSASRADPVWVESLNQSGLVLDNTFVRRDLFPPEAPVWERPNPNSGGRWIPLAEQVVRPLDPQLPAPRRSVAELMRALERFERRAEVARRRLEPGRQAVERTPDETRGLRSLGYVQ